MSEFNPTTFVNNLEQKAALVAAAVAELNARFLSFESYLAKIPGRTEAMVIKEDLKLIFRREGKDWKIFTKVSGRPNEQHITESGLRIKLIVVSMLPDFLEAIEGAQEQLIRDLQQAVAEHDAYVAQLPPNPVKGRP